MMMSNDIGIDLGTASILVYIKGKGVVLKEPSVVALDRETNKVITFGEEARLMIGRTPGNIVAVRPLRKGVISDYTVTEKMLKYFIDKAVGKRTLRKPRIAVCIPSGATEVERKAVEDATYQAGGFLAELDHQRVYLGYFIGILFVIGILYALYKKQTRFLTVLSSVGSVLTVFLVTKVQNMDDHQSLAVAPFYLLGLYMLALLAANLPGKWLRRALAALVSVGCAINFAGCSQLMPIKLPGAWYSGLFFTIDNERTDMAQIAEVNDFLRENCEGDNSAYMICHGLTYSADVFRAAALPDESIRSILAYGAVNPGNDAFPKELFTAQIVLTCTPFDPSNHTEKINSAFLENVETLHCFEVAAEFDMGNGYTITAYRRVKAPAVAELDAYRRWLAEEDEQFPYNFSAVWDQLETELANNG